MTENPIQTLIHAVERADSASQLFESVQKLAQAKDPAAIPTLITVLGYNNPGAAVAAVDGLIALGEVAIPAILEKIDGYNYGARAWAVRACACIGDPRALPLLKEAAKGDFALSVRRAAAKGLGNINWSNLPENERLTQQEEVLEILILASQDFEWVVRYASVVALVALGKSQPSFQDKILECFESILAKDEDLTVKARVKMALTGNR